MAMAEQLNIRTYIKDLAVVPPDVVERTVLGYNLSPIDLARVMAKEGFPDYAADCLRLVPSTSDCELAQVMFEAHKNAASNSVRFSILMLKGGSKELAVYAISRARRHVEKLIPLQQIINQPV